MRAAQLAQTFSSVVWPMTSTPKASKASESSQCAQRPSGWLPVSSGLSESSGLSTTSMSPRLAPGRGNVACESEDMAAAALKQRVKQKAKGTRSNVEHAFFPAFDQLLRGPPELIKRNALRPALFQGLGVRCPCRLFAASFESLGVGPAGDALARHLQLSRLASSPASMSGAAAVSWPGRPCPGWRARGRRRPCLAASAHR